MEPEPTHVLVGHVITFQIGEIKGLLTAAHQFDPADYFSGARHDRGADSTTDLRAYDFHRALLYFVATQHEGLVFNLSTLPQVWSYPVDTLSMTGVTDTSDPSVTHVTAALSFPQDNVDPDFTGQKRFTLTYTYWVKGDPQTWFGLTSAGWEGDSLINHPQFVWHPAFARAYNPATQAVNTLSYDRVHFLATVSAGQ
jgi:hypothetical protein